MGQVDHWVFPPYPGEAFVICTDGLSNELGLADIETVLLDVDDAQEAADELVRRAVQAGGRDNVTAIVVTLQGQGSQADVDEDTTPREAIGRPRREPPAGEGTSGESRSLV